ncbi:MAG: type II secretion system F family protein [Sedimentisphaerales bacterium]|nr:type II secretion system F family protein [Sedimentisphaerales bacterium]
MLELKIQDKTNISTPRSVGPATKVQLRKSNSSRGFNSHISANDIYMFTRQLANLLKAGMEIPVALEILIGQTDKMNLKLLLSEIYEQVNAGKSLAEAMGKHIDIFGDMYINIIFSAQSGGELDTAMLYMADLLEKRNKLKSQVLRAMAYPTVLLIISVLVITFLLTVVIPNITAMFIETGTELPLITSSLIYLSRGMQHILPYLLAIGILTYLYCQYYLRKPHNRLKWDKKKINLPVYGHFILEVETSRLCLSLCAMLKGGLNIVDSITLATGIIQNCYIRNSLERITEGLNKGMSVEESFRKYGIFPPMIHHAIAIGESTGQLEKQLATMAEILDEEINRTTQTITSMLEPVMMLFMGLVTGYIVAALLLPIFEINNIL